MPGRCAERVQAGRSGRPRLVRRHHPALHVCVLRPRAPQPAHEPKTRLVAAPLAQSAWRAVQPQAHAGDTSHRFPREAGDVGVETSRLGYCKAVTEGGACYGTWSSPRWHGLSQFR
eukprot:4434709-Prymnesium_polylepis.1